MERWALVSGLCGDLDLYEKIQADLKRKRGTAHLFVLGDMVGVIAIAMPCYRDYANQSVGIYNPIAFMDGGKSSF